MNIWAPHDNNYVFSIATKHDCFVESGNRTKSCFSPAAQSDFDTLSSDRSIDDVLLLLVTPVLSCYVWLLHISDL